MKVTEKLKQLGAVEIGGGSFGEVTQQEIETALGISFQPVHAEMLCSFGGSFGFELGAEFTPVEASGLERADGKLELELILGREKQNRGLLRAAASYQDQIPRDLLPFGELPGGNLVCVHRNPQVDTRLYVWDHESSPDAPLSIAALSVEELLDALEPDESPSTFPRGVIWDDVSLDF